MLGSFWQIAIKMIGGSRSTLINSKPRLHFPIPGDFGYDDPVGRKKLRPKQSAIHKIIFNHDLEQADKSQHVFQQYSHLNLYNPEKEYINNISKQRHTKSPITGLYSQKNQQPLERRKNNEEIYYYLGRQQYPLSDSKVIQDVERARPALVGDGSHLRKRQVSLDSSRLRGNLSPDSLDNLVQGSSSKEKSLDSIIRMRLRNPTFLNSHL